MTFAVESADVVGWVCLVVGILVLGTGVLIGVVTAGTQGTASTKLTETKSKLDEAKTKLDEATTRLDRAKEEGLEASGATAAVEAATASANDATRSALEQVQGIVGSLPEHLRFAGMLVLVGAVLISVATIQFGGVSLF